MVKKNKLKKYTNHIIIFFMCLFLIVMSWFVNSSIFSNGVLVDNGMLRAGLYDVFYLIYATFTYSFTGIFYLLLVGALYANLVKTYTYRRLLDGFVEKIKGNEKKALAIIVFIMGLYTSMTNEVLVVFAFVPFIISAFLRCGKDRLTTIAAAFGGIFVGLIGTTLGTYGMSWFNVYLNPKTYELIGLKSVIFIAAYVLFVVFTILHMNKHKKINKEVTKYDLFYAEPLTDEEKTKKFKKRNKRWPTILIMTTTIIFILIAYIDWESSFDVTVFTKFFQYLGGTLTVNEVPIVGSLLGFNNMDAIGTATTTDLASFALIILLVFVSIFNKISVADTLDNCGVGAKKMLKIALIYSLCFAPLMASSFYPWLITVLDKILGPDGFNLIRLFIVGVLTQVFMVDQTFIGFLYGQYFTISLAENMVLSSVIWKTAYGFALLLGPTSFILLIALTYLDVPYGKWLKFIWKYALSILLAVMIIFSVVCYV